MKAKQIVSAALTVLTFGLISCSPDKDTAMKMNPIILNSDGTFSRLGDLKITSVTSALDLQLQEVDDRDLFVTSSAVCESDFLPGPVTRETSFTKLSIIPIGKTLPIEVFKPSARENRTVNCQHHIKVIIRDEFVGEVIVKNVNLTDTATFSSFDLPFIDNQPGRYFLWHDLSEEKITLPSNNAKVQTLCDGSQNTRFSTEFDIEVKDLFDDSMFTTKSYQSCRLHIVDLNTDRTWLTPIFKFQNYQSEFKLIGLETDFPGELVNDVRGRVLAELTIKNVGQIPARFGFTERITRISQIPVYGISSRGQYRYTNALTFEARWRVKDSKALPDHFIDNQPAYVVEPNGYVTLQLLANVETIRCLPTPSPHAARSPIDCQNQESYIGSYFRIETMPTVMLDLTASPSRRRVIPFYTHAAQDVDVPSPRLPHWAPLQQVSSTCINGGSVAVDGHLNFSSRIYEAERQPFCFY